jgi:hypothetical protein
MCNFNATNTGRFLENATVVEYLILSLSLFFSLSPPFLLPPLSLPASSGKHKQSPCCAHATLFFAFDSQAQRSIKKTTPHKHGRRDCKNRRSTHLRAGLCLINVTAKRFFFCALSHQAKEAARFTIASTIHATEGVVQDAFRVVCTCGRVSAIGLIRMQVYSGRARAGNLSLLPD